MSKLACRSRIALLLAAILGAPATGALAQVTYLFDGATGQIGALSPQAFELTVPDYIATDTTFSPQELTTCTVELGECTGITFELHDINNPSLSLIRFHAGNATTYYYFTAGAFTRPGQYTMVYSGLFNPATLAVIGPPVPEPGTTTLTLAGLAALVSRRYSSSRTASRRAGAELCSRT